MNDAQVTNGSPTPASVQAYEEDWYRSLRALAERRRGELEHLDDAEAGAAAEHATDAASPTSPAVEESPSVAPADPLGTRGDAIGATAPVESTAADDAGTDVDPDLADPEASTRAAEQHVVEGDTVERPSAEPVVDPQVVVPEPHGIDGAAPAHVEGSPEESVEPDPSPAPSPPIHELFPPKDEATSSPEGASESVVEPEPSARAEHLEEPGTDGEIDAGMTPSPDPVATETAVSERQPAPELVAVAEPEPTQAIESEPGSEPEPGPEPAGPSLLSRDPVERREALLALAGREPTHDEFEAAAALMLDPDADIRTIALKTLAHHPDRLQSGTIRQALQDPADDVRALAVRVAASRGPRDAGMLMPLVGARRWPDTQKAVLEILPAVLVLAAPDPEGIDPLLSAVAELDPPLNEWELQAFAKVADAIGTSRLIDAMALPDMRRLGAVRLLAEDHSQTVREALAARAGDPIDEIRELGTAAAEALARLTAPPEAEPEPEPERGPVAEDEPEPEPEKDISALARSVRDDSPEEVEAALSSLSEIPRDEVASWGKEQLGSSDPDAVVLVAAVAVVLGLHEIGADLLERTSGLSIERRRTVVDALAEYPDPDGLAGAVASVAPDERPVAVHVVWQAFGTRVAARLRSLLSDPSIDVRVALVDVLGQSGDPASVEAVAGLLSTDASPEVRSAAVRAIAKAGAEIDDVARALQDVDAGVRATAIQELPGDPADRVGPILAEALADRDEKVRHAAMERLARVSSTDRVLAWSALRQCRPEERHALLEAFIQTDDSVIIDIAFEHLYSADEDERALAIEAVGWGATQACVEAGIRALGDPAAVVRRVAVASLGRLRDRSAVSALGKALGDPDPEVRSGAVRALGMIDDEGVLPYLVDALKDPEQSVRETASHVLTEWSSPAVAKRLAGVLTVPSLRDSAADLLMRIGPTSVELLIDVLRQGAPELRGTVGPLLYTLVGVEQFVQRMNSLEPERRLRAAEALGAIGGPDAVDSLTEALSDPDEHVRLRAAQLLGDLGDPRTAEAVARLLDDPVSEVAAAAREALETRLDRRSADGEGYGHDYA